MCPTEVHIPAPQPVQPEPAHDDFEIEDNWMDLDEDTIDYIRQRKDVAKRDLNPDQIGKNHLSDEYACPVSSF